MVICNRCGAQLPDGTVFCGNCGTQLTASQPAGDAASTGRYRRSDMQNTQPQATQGQWQQPQQSPYQRPQQAQQNAYQQSPQDQWGQQQGQWGQPPQGQWGQNPPQKGKAAAFFNKMMDNKGPADKKLLRITSLVFAIALAFFIIGLGSDIYIGRVATHGTSNMTATQKSYAKQEICAFMKKDARGYLKIQAKSELGGDSSELAELISAISETELQSTRKTMNEMASRGHKEFGILWTMLSFASHYIFFMIFFGILMLLAAGFWFWKGGRLNNFKETIWFPWVYIPLGIGVLFFFHYCIIYSGVGGFIR